MRFFAQLGELEKNGLNLTSEEYEQDGHTYVLEVSQRGVHEEAGKWDHGGPVIATTEFDGEPVEGHAERRGISEVMIATELPWDHDASADGRRYHQVWVSAEVESFEGARPRDEACEQVLEELAIAVFQTLSVNTDSKIYAD